MTTTPKAQHLPALEYGNTTAGVTMGNRHVLHPDGRILAEVWPDALAGNQQKALDVRDAYARLFVAAPEMLAYIQRTMPTACAFSTGAAKALAHDECRCAWHDARALLAKIDRKDG